MRKIITLAVVILTISQLSFAKYNKISVDPEITPIYETRKVHPIENMMGSRKQDNTRKRNNDKLLVLLVDFQEDDNSETTGNGTFNLDATSTYPIALDSPPHDYVYFSTQLQALNLYYKAASLGSYDVQYDVFPAYGAENVAYTLQHEMAYYNPGTQDNDLMVARFEEYFQEVFTEADKDEAITFADYGHYMIIHAGSDWQHDRNGDSPHDIPSFFIQVGDGKEVMVDDNATTITYACNIPETITQDTREENGVHFNYGVINAVMVHEFGHSLGFVDLYNTSNYSPGVGYYDIMDAGGSVLIGMQFEIDGEYVPYYMEGINPIFPGAFSRSIPFEDFYRSKGVMKDISEIPFDQEIRFLPISKEYDLDTLAENELFILKIPISDTEYLLIENRQVDPDGDGGTYPIGGLGSALGNRVVLGPSSTSGSDNSFNYEYDYLLPGWQDSNYNNFGGGLLVWHVDEELLYENNNFENNTVNTNYFHRAVKILEADNIADIASQYSHFWQGTAYDPFYKYQPIIDERNFFEGWDDATQMNPDGSVDFVGKIASDELSAASEPALMTNSGIPSLYRLYDISSYDINYHETFSGFEGRVMTLKVGTNLFDHTQVIEAQSTIKQVGPVATSYDLDTMPIISDQIKLHSKLFGDWAENFGESPVFDQQIDFPIIAIPGQVAARYVLASENTLYFYSGTDISEQVYDSNITATPLYIPELEALVVATEDKLFFADTEIDFSAEKLVYDGTTLIAISQNEIIQLANNGTILARNDWENYSPLYQPLAYDDLDDAKDAVFIQNSLGEIWKLQNEKLTKIFTLKSYTNLQPTNLAMAEILADHQPYLLFAAGDRTFAITIDGTYAPEFPGYLEGKTFLAGGYPKVVEIDGKLLTYFPTAEAYLSVDNQGDFLPEYSMGWQSNELNDQLFWLESDQTLNFAYTDGNSAFIASKSEVETDPIFWSGFRNGGLGVFQGEIPEFTNVEKLNCFAYPNPVKNGQARFRVQNAVADIEMKIYDIAGNLLYKANAPLENNPTQDIVWECSEISSGVYFATLKSGDLTKQVSIAIIK